MRCDGDRAEGPAEKRGRRAGAGVGLRPVKGNEVLSEGKSRRTGRVLVGGRGAAFSRRSARISFRRKAETT